MEKVTLTRDEFYYKAIEAVMKTMKNDATKVGNEMAFALALQGLDVVKAITNSLFGPDTDDIDFPNSSVNDDHSNDSVFPDV